MAPKTLQFPRRRARKGRYPRLLLREGMLIHGRLVGVYSTHTTHLRLDERANVRHGSRCYAARVGTRVSIHSLVLARKLKELSSDAKRGKLVRIQIADVRRIMVGQGKLLWAMDVRAKIEGEA